MKATQKWLVGFSSCLIAIFSLLPAVASADSFPYFKEYGADVSAGGGIYDSSGNCDPSTYQTGSTAQPYSGGIVTYAKSDGSKNSQGGSSSQYGAFADGDIDSTPGSPSSGFYSGAAVANRNVSYLSFANFFSAAPSNSWGGRFDGGSPQADQCIPDYYDLAQKDATVKSFSGNLSTTDTGIYSIDATAAGGTYTLNGGAVGVNRNVTLLVNGNIYINAPITYDVHADTSLASTPKFAIVAKGNIFIDQSVGELNGWYIAQPDPSNAANTGAIWTCHNGDGTTGSQVTFSYQNGCTKQLVVNGALTAKQLNLNRIGGDVVTQASSGEDGTGLPAAPGAAEIINYNPDVVVGGGYFDKTGTSSTSSAGGQIDKLVNLPPLF